MKTLLAGIAFALVMAFTSQAFATDAASWHPTLILLLGAIVGFILWTSAAVAVRVARIGLK